MPDALPQFRYHPDPLRNGAIIASPNVCKCCGQSRGYIYEGPVYAQLDGLDSAICPWCIADGAAAAKFDAIFIDANAIADEVEPEALTELEQRTPGYNALQEIEWRACCGDAAAFIKSVTQDDLSSGDFPKARSALLRYLKSDMDMDADEAAEFADTLEEGADHAAYLFQCLKCRKYQFHADLE